MEGKGAYNKHAALPAGGATLALPFLEEAVRNVAIDVSDRPIIIADYGSSQGKNSLAPMQLAVKNFRPRIGPSRPIVVFHIDQPTNDFNSLFEVLATDPDSYALWTSRTCSHLCDRKIILRRECAPPDSVHLGWSSYAAVWLSRIPTLIPGHFISIRGTGTVQRPSSERQAAHFDWRDFLGLRASELLPGGRLVVVLPAALLMTGRLASRASWITRMLCSRRWSRKV